MKDLDAWTQQLVIRVDLFRLIELQRNDKTWFSPDLIQVFLFSKKTFPDLLSFFSCVFSCLKKHEFICGANMYHGSFDQDLLNLKLVMNASDVNTFPFSTEWFCHFIFYFLLTYFGLL